MRGSWGGGSVCARVWGWECEERWGRGLGGAGVRAFSRDGQGNEFGTVAARAPPPTTDPCPRVPPVPRASLAMDRATAAAVAGGVLRGELAAAAKGAGGGGGAWVSPLRRLVEALDATAATTAPPLGPLQTALPPFRPRVSHAAVVADLALILREPDVDPPLRDRVVHPSFAVELVELLGRELWSMCCFTCQAWREDRWYGLWRAMLLPLVGGGGGGAAGSRGAAPPPAADPPPRRGSRAWVTAVARAGDTELLAALARPGSCLRGYFVAAAPRLLSESADTHPAILLTLVTADLWGGGGGRASFASPEKAAAAADPDAPDAHGRTPLDVCLHVARAARTSPLLSTAGVSNGLDAANHLVPVTSEVTHDAVRSTARLAAHLAADTAGGGGSWWLAYRAAVVARLLLARRAWVARRHALAARAALDCFSN